jgi:copper(I)-binding protein
VVLVAALLVGSVATGCSSGGSTAEVVITDAWARPSSAMASAGAAYMTIHNNGTPDALVGASSPAATTVEVHETVVTGSPAAGASGDGGMMGMQPVERLEIPAGGSVELKPGSYHIMLIGLEQDLNAGATIEVTLTFEKAGELTLSVPVKEG